MIDDNTIGFVGAGAIGQALAGLFTAAGHKTKAWDTDPAKATCSDMRDMVKTSKIIFICAPSSENQTIGAGIAGLISDDSRRLVISVAKGVTSGFVTIDRILEKASSGRYDFGLLHGPMLAEEIRNTGQLSAVLAISNNRWRECIGEWLADSARIEYSDDLHGTALCGVLKNIYAIGFGIFDGLGMSLNDKSSLLVSTISEMHGIIGRLGGEPGATYGLAGLGDLVATGWSDLSYNHRSGLKLVEGDRSINGEGTNSLLEIVKVIPHNKYPVLSALYQIVYKGADINTLKDSLSGL